MAEAHVVIALDNEDALAGVTVGVRVFENVEQVTALDMEHDVLEPDAPIRSELRVLAVVPSENFQAGQRSIMCAQQAYIGVTHIGVCLEPISKSFKQYQQGCELHKAQEVVRIVLPARHNTALPLDPGKKALDLPPPRVAT